MDKAILVLNSGSSSIKFAVYGVANDLYCLWRGTVDAIGENNSRLLAHDAAGEKSELGITASDHDQALTALIEWIEGAIKGIPLFAAGHRVVHGGASFSAPVIAAPDVQRELQMLCPLAPLHQPHNLHGIEVLSHIRPQLPQVACFDTAFHRNMPEVAQLFALPQEITDAGVRRYGFHGLSYEYIAEVLPQYLGESANGRVIVAHLGHGASLCALQQCRSIATTMSFSPLDGVPMATRCGAIDPSVVLYLQQTLDMSVEEVAHLLNYRSGLLGVSGVSSDMRDLLASTESKAQLAVELFAYHVVRAVGSLAAALGGLDALVFTAGIGENAAPIRARICDGSTWLGIALDTKANLLNRACISLPESKVSAWVIPTNEELMIARHTQRLVSAHMQQ